MSDVVTNLDPDSAAVIERTDLWLRCAVDGQYQRMYDLLAEDFVYTGNPKYGVTAINKPEMIKLASLLRDSGTTKKFEQRVFKIGEMILSHTITRSEERIEGDLGDIGSSEEINAGLNGKILVYVSGWRKEDGVWRCFNIHLVDALDPSTVPEYATA